MSECKHEYKYRRISVPVCIHCGDVEAYSKLEAKEKQLAEQDAELARLESMIPLVKDMEAKDRIIKACGEALEYYAHVLQIRCRMQEHDNGERAQSALKLIKDAEK